MSEKTLNVLDRHKPVEVLAGVGQATVVDGRTFNLFMIHPGEEGSGTFDMVGVDNPAIFERIMNDGIEALADGETVHVVHDSSYTLKYAPEHTGYDVIEISRQGDYYTTKSTKSLGVHDRVASDPGAPAELNIEDGGERIDGFFSQGRAVFGIGKTDMGFFELGGKIADIAHDMGLVDTEGGRGGPFPLPSVLRANIARLREAGLDIPNIKFFKDGAIEAEPFIMAWAGKEEGIDEYHEGEFPASEEPGYMGHDLMQEHKRPLDIFRGDAMIFATLYSRAVLEADQIVGSIPIDEYQINAERPQMKDVVLEDQDKLDHASYLLDQFSGEFDDVVRILHLSEDDPETARAFTSEPSHSWRNLPDMVRTILNSAHRDAFIAHLTEMGSQALNVETNEFSYETYMREIFRRAQDFWGIDPQPVAPTQQGADYDYDANALA